MGAETELLIKAGDAQVILLTNGRPNVNPGERIGLALDPAAIHLFDQQTGQRLAA
jgi:multiple sugar transport system ATP-binding protein